MKKTDGVPSHILGEKESVRLSYFRSRVITHPRLKETDTALMHVIKEPAGVSLAFLCGPRGVGKTTVRHHIEKKLSEYIRNERHEHNLAIVGVDAVAPDTGSFAWGDFYRRTLKQLEGPFLPENTKDTPIGIYRDRFGEIIFNHRLQMHELRQALEYSLRYREPYALLIDEAQHIAKMSSGRKLQDQMDCLKHLAQQSKTLIVLIGTYELQALRNLSGQLSCRSMHLHFSRYDTSEEDLKSFRNIIYNLQNHLPLANPPNLLKHWEYLYTRSIGCTGILKDWLTRSLASVLEENSRTITSKRLQECALPASQCERIAMEIIEGERCFASEDGADRRLTELIGLNRKALLNSPSEETSDNNRQVGARKPHRDKIQRFSANRFFKLQLYRSA